jgi:peptide/nickel transport system substrate-binding protein
MIDKAVTTQDATARNKQWSDVDRKVMDDAFILPGIWARGLLYRPTNLTNVFVTDGFQMYDYLALGTTRK